MESRNPYAASQVPLIASEEPAPFSTDPETFEYGGFWRRVGSGLLDAIILIPLGVSLFVLLNYTRHAHLYYAFPSVAVYLFFYIWLVQRFGGTPGKRILSMRIAMADGSPVTTRAATLRYLPTQILQILSLTAMIQASFALGTEFESLGFLEKLRAQQMSAPAWNNFVTWGTYAWLAASALTLVANPRKRAIHDFIAGTIVLRTD